MITDYLSKIHNVDESTAYEEAVYSSRLTMI